MPIDEDVAPTYLLNIDYPKLHEAREPGQARDEGLERTCLSRSMRDRPVRGVRRRRLIPLEFFDVREDGGVEGQGTVFDPERHSLYFLGAEHAFHVFEEIGSNWEDKVARRLRRP